MRGFSYTDPDGERHHVTPEGVGKTDLASVPSILWWFVASYGRQTRAALVHDELIDQIERQDADWVFRRALGDSGIGWARRWLAWSAVSFETTFRTAWQPTDQAKTQAIPDTAFEPMHHRRATFAAGCGGAVCASRGKAVP